MQVGRGFDARRRQVREVGDGHVSGVAKQKLERALLRPRLDQDAARVCILESDFGPKLAPRLRQESEVMAQMVPSRG